MRLSRGGNTLIGAGLHAAARKNNGLELTGLEELLVGVMSSVLSEDEVSGFGRVYQEETSAAGAAELFPEFLTGRGLAEGFPVGELVAEFPRIGAEIAAQPNANLVRIDADAPDRPLDSEEFIEALATYGGGITVVVGPQAEERGVSGAESAYVKLSYHDFRCIRRSGELGKDEIYWTSSAGSDTGDVREYESPEFGEVVTGSHRYFDTGSYLFIGNVEKWFTCNISCWEADHSSGGWYASLRQGLREISDYCFKASEDLESNTGEYEGSSAWFSLVGLIARLFDWLLNLITNKDDLVKERSFGFTRSALLAMSNTIGGSTFSFNGGGGGHHELNIRTDATAVPSDTTVRYTALTGSGWSADTSLPGATTGTPAVASYAGTLHCVVRGLGNRGLYWTTLTDAGWSSFTQVAGIAEVAQPALAEYNGKLYCLFRDTGNGLHLLSYDGERWDWAPNPSARTTLAPAIAVHGGKLYCVVRGETGNDLYVGTFNGTTWTAFSRIQAVGVQTRSAPALAVDQTGKLTCIFRAHDDTLCYTYFPYTNSSPWTPVHYFKSGSTAAAPAVAAHGGQLYCMVRGANTNTKLYWTTGSGRFGFQNIFTPINASSGITPALASHNGVLYCVHRG